MINRQERARPLDFAKVSQDARILFAFDVSHLENGQLA